MNDSMQHDQWCTRAQHSAPRAAGSSAYRVLLLVTGRVVWAVGEM